MGRRRNIRRSPIGALIAAVYETETNLLESDVLPIASLQNAQTAIVELLDLLRGQDSVEIRWRNIPYTRQNLRKLRTKINQCIAKL